jgi:GNAT superfamily N-acetyltransferase
MQTFVVDTNVLLSLLETNDDRATRFLSATRLRADLRFWITEALEMDFELDPDVQRRKVHMNLISTLERIELPLDANRGAITSKWLEILFPRSRPGSHTYDHNCRDALHVAVAMQRGADFFVTQDKGVLSRSDLPELKQLSIVSFDAMLDEIEASTRRKADMWSTDVAQHTAFVRVYTKQDRSAVEAVALELRELYPGIMKWIGGKLDAADRLSEGKSVEAPVRIFLPVVEDAVAGYALYTRRRDSRVVKLGTFYIKEEFRKLSIGFHLLYHLLRQWDQEQVDAVHVTFTKELHDDLMPVLSRYGFELVGAQAEAYRPGTCELVARKRFIRGTVEPGEFRDFVVQRYLGGLPAEVTEYGPMYQVRDHLRGTAELMQIDYETGSKVENRVSKSICLTPPRIADEKVIDGLALERLFFPLEVRWPTRAAFLLPIREQYARRLFQFLDQQALFGPSPQEMKTLLRPDNVYFKTPDARVKRGDIVLFYVSGKRQHLVGEAVVTHATTGDPQRLYEQFGHKGVLREDEVCALGNQVLVFQFDFFREFRYPEKLNYRYLKHKIPNLNVQTYFRVPYRALHDIREDGQLT